MSSHSRSFFLPLVVLVRCALLMDAMHIKQRVGQRGSYPKRQSFDMRMRSPAPDLKDMRSI